MATAAFQDVTRLYTSGDHELRALDDASFTLDEGKFVVILGPSGAGKSTLLNLLGGLDSPTGIGVLQWLLVSLAGEYELSLTVRPSTYILSIALTFGVSLLVGAMVAAKNKHIDMVEALKGAE